MPNLERLKERLKKLPERRALREYAEHFGLYTQKVKQLREKMKRTHKDMVYASKVNPNPDYDRNVLSELKKAVREAKKLHKVIEEDPQKVKTRATENTVVSLGDYASKANTQCHDIWTREIEGIIAKWEKIAVVVQNLKNLGAKGGSEFKQAVDKLKLQAIPQNDKEVEQVRTAKKDLQKGIATLGLEGPFGKFLEAAAKEIASPRDLLNDEVRSKLDEYKLWDSFHVGL